MMACKGNSPKKAVLQDVDLLWFAHHVAKEATMEGPEPGVHNNRQAIRKEIRNKVETTALCRSKSSKHQTAGGHPLEGATLRFDEVKIWAKP